MAVFTKQALNDVTTQYHNKKWLMVLWSVDCPPCFKELSLLSKLAQAQPNLPVVLINTDDDESYKQQRIEVIAKYGLEKLSNYYFAPNSAAQSRYIIDAKWFGELPRSYFYDENGKRTGLSGLIDKKTLSRWVL